MCKDKVHGQGQVDSPTVATLYWEFQGVRVDQATLDEEYVSTQYNVSC